jgi:hypothetical protein
MAQIDLNRLRQKYLTIIQGAKKKLEWIDELEADATDVATPEDKEEEVVVAEHQPPDRSATNGKVARYRNMMLTDAVVDAVNQIGKNGVTIPELRDYLLEHGLESHSQHILNTITTAISRQASRGNVRSERLHGKRRFFPVGTA